MEKKNFKKLSVDIDGEKIEGIVLDNHDLYKLRYKIIQLIKDSLYWKTHPNYNR